MRIYLHHILQSNIPVNFLASLFSGVMLLFSLFAWSQETVPVPKELKNKIGLKIISARVGDDRVVPVKEFKIVTNYGISYDRKIASFIFIESGLYFINKKIVFALNDSLKKAVPFEFYNLRLPVMVRLETKYVYSSAGLYFDYLMGYEAVNKYYYEQLESEYDLKRFSTGICLQAGIQLPVAERFNLFVEGMVMHDLTRVIYNQYGQMKFLGYWVSLGGNFRI